MVILAAPGVLKGEEVTTLSNRLSLEKSPYLLQHAHNPVDWYPWGPEAFEKARREDKPIFLSIGYSTCHWCHVMEHESFENPATAQILNEHFVSIKVDREERPDLDGVYMQFVMAANGSGGWPMSVFLTPDKKPFYGGTYFPPVDRYGMPGFPTLLNSIASAWKERREEIIRSSDSSAAFLSQKPETVPSSMRLGRETLLAAAGDFKNHFDAAHGGFGGAPKFPRSHAYSFLLGEAHYEKDSALLAICERSLEAMDAGGMTDHLGGGFHRYSTDALWRVPHFEKMLYDQALLVRTYLDAYRLTKNPEDARVVRETLEYVLRDLTDSAGGFYSAEDADSADPADRPSAEALVADRQPVKREGAFYVWTKQEVQQLLGAEKEAVFSFYYGIEEKGNAISDPHKEFINQNVLYRAHTLAQTAAQFQKTELEISTVLAAGRNLLLEARSKRPRPHRDDKVLTDWNGLMLGAFADAARALDEPRYLEAARRAAEFIEMNLVREKVLYHRWREGQSAIPAFLADEVFLAEGYLLLYEASFDKRWFDRAQELARDILLRFKDEKNGAFYMSAHDAEPLFARSQEIYDGAIPSGNSMAAHLLYRLAAMMDNTAYRDAADRILETFAGAITANPSQYPQALMALRHALGPAREVVLAGEAADPVFKEMARETGFSFSPNQVTLFQREGPPEMKAVGGRPTAYVCVHRACRLPETDPGRLKQSLSEEISKT